MRIETVLHWDSDDRNHDCELWLGPIAPPNPGEQGVLWLAHYRIPYTVVNRELHYEGPQTTMGTEVAPRSIWSCRITFTPENERTFMSWLNNT